MESKAATVEQYLAELPAERRAAISAIRQAFGEQAGTGVLPLEQTSIHAVVRELEEMVLREGRERTEHAAAR